ncbi:hypothetical protein HQ590_09520, partial [bacterium]|nr:hypothetical protein [bacterium]
MRGALPMLQKISRCLAAAPDQAAFQERLTAAEGELRECLLRPGGEDDQPEQPPASLGWFAGRSELGPEHVGLNRVLYQLFANMPELYLAPDVAALPRVSAPEHIRVPSCGECRTDAVIRWMAFMRLQLGPANDYLLVLPDGLPLVDIIVGEPTVAELTCLLQPLEPLPLTSDTPYSIEADFGERTERAIAERGDIHAYGEQDLFDLVLPEQAVLPRALLKSATVVGGLWQRCRETFWTALGDKPRKTLLMAAGVLLGALLLVGLMAALLGLGDAPPPGSDDTQAEPLAAADLQVWRELCDSYYGWLGVFLTQLNADRRTRWRGDPQLAELLKLVPETGGAAALDPRQIVGQPGASLKGLGDNPPDELRDPQTAQLVRQAGELLAGLETALASGNWSARGRMKQAAAIDHPARGWKRSADFLAALCPRITPSPTLAETIDDVLEAASVVADIEQRWKSIQNDCALAEDAGSPVLARLDDFAQLESRRVSGSPPRGDLTDITDLLTAVDSIANVTGRVADFVRGQWPLVDKEKFLAAEPELVPPTEGDEASETTFAMWLSAAERFVVEDPGTWLGRIRGVDRIVSPEALNTVWRQRRDAVLADVTAETLAAKQETYFPLRDGVAKWRDFLIALDDDEQMPGDLPDPGEGVPPRGWHTLLVRQFADVRARRLAELAASALGPGGLPVLSGAEFKDGDEWERTRSSLLALRKQVARMRDECAAVETALESFYLPADRASGTAEETMGQLMHRWRESSAAVAALATHGLSGLFDRVAALEQIGQEQDRRRLVAAVEGAQPHTVYAIWHRLGRLPTPPWPATAAELVVEQEMRTALKAPTDRVAGRRGESLRADLQLESMRRDVVFHGTVLAETDDPLLGLFPRFAAAEGAAALAEAGDADRRVRMEGLRDLAAALATVVGSPEWGDGTIDRKAFAEDPAARLDDTETPDAGRFEAWQTAIRGYHRLAPDPRGDRAAWQQKLTGWDRELTQLARVAVGGGNLSEVAVAELREGLTVAREETRRLWELPGLTKHRPGIDARLKTAQAATDGLAGRTAEAWRKTEPPEQWLQRMAAVVVPATEKLIADAWRRHRAALLEGASAESLSKDTNAYAKLRGAVTAVDDFLGALATAAAQDLPPGLLTSGSPAEGIPVPEWEPAVAAALQVRQTRALAMIIGNLPWQDDPPATSFETFRAAAGWRDPVDAYAEQRAQFGALRADVVALERLLADGRRLDEAADGSDAATLAAKWEKHPVMADKGVAAALAPVIDSVRRLRAIAKTTAAGDLLGAARDAERLPIAVAAWRQLGTLPAAAWPKTPGDLAEDAVAADRLAALVKKAPIADMRRRELLTEIGRERGRRWQVLFNRIADPAAVAAAVELLAAPGVAGGPFDPLGAKFGPGPNLLTGEARFNLLLYRLRNENLWAPENDAALTRRDNFLARLAKLPDGLAGKGVIALFAQALKAVKPVPATEEPDLAKAGPGRVGWKLDAAHSSSDFAVYGRELGGSEYRVAFRKVPPAAAGQKAAYVGTTEVSLGLFTAAVDAAGKEQAWGEVGRLFERGFIQQLKLADPRLGPRVWDLSMAGTDKSLRFRPAEAWTSTVLWPAKSDYAEGVTPGGPAVGHPVQRLSPGAALYVARLLGCRLPTPG